MKFKKKVIRKRWKSLFGNPRNWDASQWSAARDIQDHLGNINKKKEVK